jgi:hypothetical protein
MNKLLLIFVLFYSHVSLADHISPLSMDESDARLASLILIEACQAPASGSAHSVTVNIEGQTCVVEMSQYESPSIESINCLEVIPSYLSDYSS